MGRRVSGERSESRRLDPISDCSPTVGRAPLSALLSTFGCALLFVRPSLRRKGSLLKPVSGENRCITVIDWPLAKNCGLPARLRDYMLHIALINVIRSVRAVSGPD